MLKESKMQILTQTIHLRLFFSFKKTESEAFSKKNYLIIKNVFQIPRKGLKKIILLSN